MTEQGRHNPYSTREDVTLTVRDKADFTSET